MALLADKTAQTAKGKIKDALNFTPYAHALTQLILDEDLETPLTIGIFGSWGTGKSTLMRMIEEHLKEAELDGKSERITHPIPFNAWRYSKEGALWRALLATVVNGIRKMDVVIDNKKLINQDTTPEIQIAKKRAERDAELDALIAKLYQTMTPPDLGSLSIDLADILDPTHSGGAQITLSLQDGLKLIDNINNKVTDQQKPASNGSEGATTNSLNPTEQPSAIADQIATLTQLRQQVRHTSALLTGQRVEFIEQFNDEFKRLMDTYVVEYGYLVIFVDDLDRCLPEKAVEILEAIKLFLDVEGCIFILAIDQDVVERGIQIRYGEVEGKSGSDERHKIDGRRYLEKIIQIPFVLPPISPRSMGEFIQSIAPKLPSPCKQIFIQGLVANPRHVKRAINIYTLLELLSNTLPVIKPVRLAKIVVLQQRFEDLYDSLRKKPALLIEWEQWLLGPLKNWPKIDVNQPQFAGIDPNSTQEPKDIFKEQLPELYDLTITNPEEFEALKALLTMRPATATDVLFSDLAPKDVHTYLYLASTVEESETHVAQAQSQPPPVEKSLDSIFEAVEEDNKEIYIVYSEMDEGQRSYITAALVRQLEELYATVASSDEIDSSVGNNLLWELAQHGFELYTQLFTNDDKRQEFEKRASTITKIEITPVAGEDLIPWELIYNDEPGVQPNQYAPNSAQRGIAQISSFWGGRYMLERPFASKNENLPRGTTSTRPTIHYIVDPTTPHTSYINTFMGLFNTANQITTLEGLRDSITRADADIYLIQGCCGVDNAGTWIKLDSKELLDDSINLSELVKVITKHFSLDELAELSFVLGVRVEDIYGSTLNSKARELTLYMQRRGRLNELTAAIREARPNVPMEFLSQEEVRLTRQQLNNWKLVPNQGNGNKLLFLNVDSSIVQHNDWAAWLDSFANLGFSGIIAPTIAPALERTADFLEFCLTNLIIAGLDVGTALLQARQQTWEDEFDPIGLYYAYYGRSDLMLKN